MTSSAPGAVLRRAVDAVAGCLRDLEPDRVSTGDATALFALFAEMGRLVSAGQVLLAPRVAQADTWKADGHRSAASWVARATGTGLGDAIATFETAQRLLRLPETEEALRDGRLSAPQVREIAAAAASRPQSERELLEIAATCTLKGLRDRCRRVRAVATSAEEDRKSV